MANILDIFRTHSGDKLVEKTCEETGLSKPEAKRALLFTFPLLLSIHKSKCETGDNHFKDISKDLHEFTGYLQEDNLSYAGESVLHIMISDNQKEKICSLSRMLAINESSLEKILNITAAALFSIIKEITIKRSLKREDHCVLLDTLAGINAKYTKDFVAVLVKNDDSPGIIDTAEEISLSPDNNDKDDSILGGYTGGK